MSYRAVVQCGDCSWEGKRQYPEKLRPCPACGSRFILRRYRTRWARSGGFSPWVEWTE